MEINTFTLQQLLAGEDIFLIKEVVVLWDKNNNIGGNDTATPLSISPQAIIPKPLYRPKHKVVILVKELNPTDAELLGKILGAVQLTLQTVEVIEMSKNLNIDLTHIFTQNSVKQLISFGVMMSEVNLMLRLTPYQILESKGVKFISGVSLTDLQNDIPKKKLLWGALKEMF